MFLEFEAPDHKITTLPSTIKFPSIPQYIFVIYEKYERKEKKKSLFAFIEMKESRTHGCYFGISFFCRLQYTDNIL